MIRSEPGQSDHHRTPEKTVNEVMTLPELAQYLRVHPSTIYRRLRRRELPAIKVGRDWRFSRESIERWIRQEEIRQKECG
jgi:excisionase family DNA binding protein